MLEWQGQPVKVKYGFCEVYTNKDKLLLWSNYFTLTSTGIMGKAQIKAIEVTTKDGEVFYLANMYGIGYFKLSHGGWPNYSHYSFNTEFEFVEDDAYIDTSFNKDLYEKFVLNLEQWREENYSHTDEYKKYKELVNQLKNE